jgi:hypothetical protein
MGVYKNIMEKRQRRYRKLRPDYTKIIIKIKGLKIIQ